MFDAKTGKRIQQVIKEKPAIAVINEPYAEVRALDRKLCAALPVGHSDQLNFDTGKYEVKPRTQPGLVVRVS